MARSEKKTLTVRFEDLTDYDNLDTTAYAEAYIYAVYGVTVREWWEIVRDFGIENVFEEAQRRVMERTAHKRNKEVKGRVKNEYYQGTAYQA